MHIQSPVQEYFVALLKHGHQKQPQIIQNAVLETLVRGEGMDACCSSHTPVGDEHRLNHPDSLYDIAVLSSSIATQQCITHMSNDKSSSFLM